MIKAKRVLIIGSMSVSNVKMYNPKEQQKFKIPQVFNDMQWFLVDDLKKQYIINQNMIYMIYLKKFYGSKEGMIKLKRVNLTYDQINFSPSWIIPHRLYDKHNIPKIYWDDHILKQCTIIADNMIIITSDDLVTSIEL